MKQVNHKGIVMNVMEWKKKLIKLNQIILFRCFKINEQNVKSPYLGIIKNVWK